MDLVWNKYVSEWFPCTKYVEKEKRKTEEVQEVVKQ